MHKSPAASLTRRQLLKGAAGLAGASALGWPALSFAQNKPIRVGMPTILSGRVAQLGLSSRYAAVLEVERFNAAGGLNGRPIELVVRDSKGQPQEAARVARELVNSEGCEILLDAEASSGAFAVHEVARDLKVLCIHTNSETSSLTADPALRIPNAFRCARQGIHDAIVGGAYAARVSKEKGLKRWMSCSPDYAYGRDTTAEFFQYLKHFQPDVEITGGVWPKLFQADYSEIITRLVQGRPQAVYTALWGGDLTSFIDQGSIYALFKDRQLFAVNMADYTVLTAVKNVPAGLQSGNRYLRSVPDSAANHAWADAYFAKHKEMPTNWAWQNAAGVVFLTTAMKKVNSADGAKIAEALRGMTIDSPFGTEGKLTLRAEDQTLIDYADAWGELSNKEPYMPKPQLGSWAQIAELELDWKKSKGWAK
ncbi:ABC transporter substrate-binding protein [Bordetella hinzii]|uniref:ABC transporter substrate-binding protein n=2 Tax=Bordetella hinzii TaxID=103855 RepID=A0AAN1RXC3_9BORD|nr:ABC transporter substrate-binding protein [Bordetella hinzii]AKQ56995.1 Leucine-, isoleucine-, valine-, threonine-, and alanine-binding protein precursor [Bordetella hinzii]AKQ61461.1 Leucine-, isoleucine-, valine-, threonine-, and alanine-binding protein precursor [Bordetella hinzii]AZW17570.1 ABC transporter substrate-binding protein [Bordetella hinzii]KCB23913.1 periplasmic-binding protein domain protein [Bordetella hinzii OH87 BAL007II]KCB27486.1 periplasmic-binding protein domain prote